MKNSKRGSIPMQEKLKLSKSQGASTPDEMKRMQNVPYASAVGSIMYAVRCTRPDVALAQKITSRFQQIPYADDLKSQTGYFFVLNGGVVDWKSAKQNIYATSSAEAEYIAAFDASKEAVWVRKFISGLSVVPTIEEPINMYCDNTGAIAIANESGITKGARHFRAKVHYLREVIAFGDIKLEKIHTDDNLADPFTKALAFPKHSEHTKNIGMLPANLGCESPPYTKDNWEEIHRVNLSLRKKELYKDPKVMVREEPHELGTSILGRVADRTTSPALAGTTIPCASLEEIVVTRPDPKYLKAKENAEAYPYVWSSYLIVYGGFGVWVAYRYRKLMKTEDRVKGLQELSFG
nr:hypothetical protein [Tanacetum cinerariifolium]